VQAEQGADMKKRVMILAVPVLFLFGVLFLFTSCPSPTSSLGSSGRTLSSTKDLTGFGLPGAMSAVLEGTTHTVSVLVLPRTVISNLIPTFSISGATVKVGSTVQISGVTAQDFTNPVVYVVFAEDGSSVSYTVSVAFASTNANLSNLAVTDGSTTYLVDPPFSPTTYTGYSVSFATSTNTYTLLLTVSDPGATITSVMEGSLGFQVALAPSAGKYALLLSTYFDVVTVLVTAQDGVTQQTYTINAYPSWRG
jgi:hypothetical protein